MRRLAVLALAFLAIAPPASPDPVSPAVLPDCDADDNGATQHAIPMTSAGEGGCRDTLIVNLDDFASLWYPAWRRWDQTVRVDVLDPAVIRVVRTVSGQEWERQEGAGPIVLTRDVPQSMNIQTDLGIREVISIELLVGAVVDIEITVTQVPHSDGDCGGADTSTGSRATLAPGVACYGRFVDGWRFGQVETDSPGAPSDGYVLPAITDADIVTIRGLTKGHSYDVSYGDRNDAAGTTAWTSQLYRGTMLKDVKLVKNGAGPLYVDVRPVYPDTVVEVICGEYWCDTISHFRDAYSYGPFDYNLTATVVANDRPTFTVADLPAFAFDGDTLRFSVTVTDPDGDSVGATATTGWTWGATTLSPSPATGASGTAFAFVDGPLSGVGTRILQLNAFDAPGASALLSDQTRYVAVHPADCGAGRGDAPVAGRLFFGSCTGWVGADDPSDLLLRDVAAGPHRVSFVVAGLGASITSPTGTTRAVAANELYLDYAPDGGRYEIRLAATDANDPYTIRTTDAAVPAAEGLLRVTSASNWTAAAGDLTPDGAVTVATGGAGASRSFDVPADVLDRATSARLHLVGQATSCSGRLNLYVRSTHATFAPACTWSATGATWGSVPIPLASLAAGANRLELKPVTSSFAFSVDRTYLSDASQISGSGDTTGELVWILEIATSALDPSGAPQRGVPAVYRFVVDDTGGEDAVVTLDWGDGSPQETFPATWGVAVSRVHAYAAAGAAPLAATAAAGSRSYPAAPAIDVHLPADCGGVGDAPAAGRLFASTCAGWLAGDDPQDVLLVDLPAGRHAQFTVAGANAELLPPTGPPIAFLDGVAHEWTGAGGRWAVRLTPIGSPASDVPYTLGVTSAAAVAPTGAVAGAIPAEWAAGVAMPLSLLALDLHYDDVALAIDWGDGAPERLPAAGHAPSGAFAASHAWAAPGTYAITAAGANRAGVALAPLLGSVRVVLADDCGAVEAPNANSAGVPFLPEGRCWGLLNATDTIDYYVVPTVIGEGFEVVVCSYGGVAMTPTLFYRLPGGTGIGGAAFVRTTAGPGGCQTLSTGALGPALGDQYLLKLERTASAGAYTVEIRRP